MTVVAWRAAPSFMAEPAWTESARMLHKHWLLALQQRLQTARGVSVEAGLIAAARSAMIPDWDGFGAKPVRRRSLQNARLFLQMLPTAFRAPDIGVDPEGNVSLEWYRSPTAVVFASVGDIDVAYAAIVASDRHHGSVRVSAEIPSQIVDLLVEVHSGITW